MKFNKLYLLILSILLISNRASTQVIGLGITANAVSQGININYSLTENKKWKNDIGIRIMVNTFDWDMQDYNSTGNGYAWKWWEHFSFNYRLSRYFVHYKGFELGAMMNVHIGNYGTLDKSYDIPVYIPEEDSMYIKPFDIQRHKAALSVELVLGLQLSYKLSDKLSIQGATGVGAIYQGYSYTPDNYYSIITGERLYAIRSGWTGIDNRGFGKFLNKVSIVGMERLWWSIGVKYDISRW